jgi:hypothetical protein
MILTFLRKLIPDCRNQVVRWALKGVNEHADFDYLEVRPLVFGWKPRIKSDCSFFVDLVYFMAGARSPMGTFDGYGNSQTLFQRGRRSVTGLVARVKFGLRHLWRLPVRRRGTRQ